MNTYKDLFEINAGDKIKATPLALNRNRTYTVTAIYSRNENHVWLNVAGQKTPIVLSANQLNDVQIVAKAGA